VVKHLDELASGGMILDVLAIADRMLMMTDCASCRVDSTVIASMYRSPDCQPYSLGCPDFLG
jgi:hypothetical protein